MDSLLVNFEKVEPYIQLGIVNSPPFALAVAALALFALTWVLITFFPWTKATAAPHLLNFSQSCKRMPQVYPHMSNANNI